MFLKSSISSSQVTSQRFSYRASLPVPKGGIAQHPRIINRRRATTTTSTTTTTTEECIHRAVSKSFLERQSQEFLDTVGVQYTLSFTPTSSSRPSTVVTPSQSIFSSLESLNGRKRMNIIVQGKWYQTYEETLNRHPGTLLGEKSSRDEFFDQDLNALVFENSCHRSFDAILFYYQSNGILSRPDDVPRLHFIEELEFFSITKFMDNRQEQDAYHLKEIMKEKIVASPQTCSEKLWMVLRHQNTSLLGQAWTGFHLVITILSVILICVASLPNTRFHMTYKYVMVCDLCFNMIYTLELGGQFLVAPHFKQFTHSIHGVVDVCTPLFYYVFLLLYYFNVTHNSLNRISQFLLTSRVLKLFKYCESARYILYTLTETRYYLQLFATSASILFFWFAIIIYLVESGLQKHNDGDSSETSIKSIGDGVWYIIITCTGVGYGDVYPSTVLGKMFGSAFCLIGLLLFCLPTSVLMNKFIDFYFLAEAFQKESDKDREKILETREELLAG